MRGLCPASRSPRQIMRMERDALWEEVFLRKQSASPVPSGGSPDGTGRWPVPPLFANGR